MKAWNVDINGMAFVGLFAIVAGIYSGAEVPMWSAGLLAVGASINIRVNK